MFGGDSSKAVASILSIVLSIVPLISILYATIYWYNSEPFTRLLLTQPLKRSTVYISNWFSVSIGLAGSFALSTGLALIVQNYFDANTIIVLFFGCILTFVFTGIGLLVSVLIADRMKGVGTAFLLWFYFSILHDILVFAIVSTFKNYPVEIPAMIMMAINPIDLTRVQVLLSLDLSAMMGYTGRILQSTLSGALGYVLTASIQLMWMFLPLLLGIRIFSKKDL
jgi:Cu-processing system permease protein